MQQGFSPIIILVNLLLLIAAIGISYNLGAQNSIRQSAELTAQNHIPASTRPTPLAKDFVGYIHLSYHTGIPVFEMEIPGDWSGFAIFSSPPNTVIFGNSQPTQEGKLRDMYPKVKIKYSQDKNLINNDPITWDQKDQIAFFEAAPLPDKWDDFTINSLPAKKGLVQDAGGNREIIYLVKDNILFTFSNYSSDAKKEYEHILSSFRIINSNF